MRRYYDCCADVVPARFISDPLDMQIAYWREAALRIRKRREELRSRAERAEKRVAELEKQIAESRKP